jgi:hypothetical protein
VNGNRGLIIAVAASFIVGCSVGLMGGIVFTHLVGHGPGFGRGGAPPFMERRGPGGPGGPERRERMFTYMSRKMGLSPEQSKRIEALIDQARRQHEAVRESTEAALDRELTPEQRVRWRELEKEMGMRRHGGREGPPPDRP